MLFSLEAEVDGGGGGGQPHTHELALLLDVVVVLLLQVPEDFSEVVGAEEVAVLLGAFEVVGEGPLDDGHETVGLLRVEASHVHQVHHLACPDDGVRVGLPVDSHAAPHQLLQLLLRTLPHVDVAVGGGLALAGSLLAVVIQDELVFDVMDELIDDLEVVTLHLLPLPPGEGLAVVGEAG
jgi:hypothetical protein